VSEEERVLQLTRAILELLTLTGVSDDIAGVACLQAAAAVALHQGSPNMKDAYERLARICAGIANAENEERKVGRS